MDANENFQDLHFPKGGIDRSRAAQSQPWRQGPPRFDGEPTRIYTCHDGVNVRGFDPLSSRFRGGSRIGLKRYCPSPAVAGWIVQHLNTVVGVEVGVATQTSQLGRVVTGIAVSQGKVFWFEPADDPADRVLTEATNNSATTPPLNFTGVMDSSPNNQKLYIVDGVHYRYFVPITNTVETWTATAGTLPVDGSGNRARLITTWRGRTVLSGLIDDSQNWFMSAVSNPHDFDYAPASATATQAVAGNNSRLGFIGDTITALMAYNDDVILFGGNTSIEAIRGDPMAGGERTNITSAIGVAWGKAFTQDPMGNIYFMANTGEIWGMVPGGKPEKISTPIDSLVQGINTGEKCVRLEWNQRMRGFHVFVSSLAAPDATDGHFFWEGGTSNGWWRDTFADKKFNPLASCTIDGNTPNDRVVLIGSWDGYIRSFDPDATTDDGKPINWQFYIGPLLTKNFDEIIVKSIQAVMAEGSGTVNYEVLYGRTAELAAQQVAVARAKGTFTASRSYSKLGSPVAGHAIYVRLYGTDRVAMEAIRVSISGKLSKVRRRGFA